MNIVELVVWLNLGLACVAAGVSFHAAFHGMPTRRAHHAGIGALSVLYVIGYVWLLAHPERAGVWSEFFRGVSLVAWSVVWILPARQSVESARDAAAKLDELEQRVKERLS